MKTIYTKSNILLAATVVFIFITVTISILQIQEESTTIGITVHPMKYIGCLSAEDNVSVAVVEGDSNKIEVTPDIEMFYSSGCLTVFGSGSAILTVEKNTIEMIVAKNNATIRGEPGDSVKTIQASDNSFVHMKIKHNIPYMEISAKGNSIIKIDAPSLDSLYAEAIDRAMIKINAKVNKLNQTLKNRARIKIK